LKDTDLLNLLISKTVSIAIEKGIIKSKSIIVDATHSLSRSNPLSPLEVLRERARQLRKVVYSTDESWKERMPKKNEDNDLELELSYCDTLEFQETEYFKEKTKHRYEIEAKNSELKNVHGYGRATSYGINNMQMQGAMAIFTVNVKRIIKLMN